MMDWQEIEREAEEARLEQAAIPSMDSDAHVIGSKAAFESGVNAAALMAMQFPPIRYIVSGYIAEGLSLLAGAPKIGKSWMALNIAVAVADGRPAFGQVPCVQGDVLYLALEDNLRRLRSRLLTMGIVAPPKRLTFCTEWPSIADGAVEEIEAWADSVANPVLVILDVLAKVRDEGGKDAYAADYKTLTGLQQLASKRSMAIVPVHHTRKMVADDDPFDSVSGTRGLTGAADTVLVLKRDIGTGHTKLYGRGRDVEEIETVVEFDCHNATWKVIGAAAEIGKTDERQAILNTLKETDNPLNARELSDILGKSYDTIRKTLARMAHSGEVEKPARGLYTCPKCPNVPSDADNRPNWDTGTDGTGVDAADDMEGWIGESPSQTASHLGQIAGAA